MIRRIKITNFGSLRDVDVELGPLTLLLGPNASGKSMFIRALRTLSKLLAYPIRGETGEFTIDHAKLNDLVFSGIDTLRMSFTVWLEDPNDDPNYFLELGKIDGLWAVTGEKLRYRDFDYDSEQGPFEFRTQRSGVIQWATPGEPPRHATLIRLVYRYRDDPIALREITPILKFASAFGISYGFRVNPTDLATPVLPPWIDPLKPWTDSTGNGFVHSLRQWFESVRGGKLFREKVLPELHNLFPHIRGIGFESGAMTTSKGVSPRLNLAYDTERSPHAIPAQLESDGVNIALFFLTIPYLLGTLETESICIGLEEPEAGTHPHLLRNRLALLRSLTGDRTMGIPIQIVGTTHSVDLVRWVAENEALSVLRFVEHLGPDKGTLIHRLVKQEELEKVYQEYEGNPGIAWYSGVFGGNPETPSL